jgi:tetratricopeptide (TPR) repeat protein
MEACNDRGILMVDIEAFSRPHWTDQIRVRQRGRLYGLIAHALASARISSGLTDRNDTGDGVLLVVHHLVAIQRLINPVATELARALAHQNGEVSTAERMRLRVVIHMGPVVNDPHGHVGSSLNHAARLLDADVTRLLLARHPKASVLLATSDAVHQQITGQPDGPMDPDGWQSIRVHLKETRTRAWVIFPGLRPQPRLPAVLLAPQTGPAVLPIPRQLPRPPGDFTGRAEELAKLFALLEHPLETDLSESNDPVNRGRTVVITAIDGMGGIGKSALAFKAAEQLAEKGIFSDGQLYINLHGATPEQPPLEPLEALGRMLRGLGLHPAQVPVDADEAAARFRTLTADRRLLIVLDNANSSEQVRHLLPASPTCGVLVTSRRVLATLEGACSLHLDLLPLDESIELLAQIAGSERIHADPQAAIQVARLCGQLPLAVRIAGARLAAQPDLPIGVLATWLADETRRLDELRAEELAVQASFSISLRALERSPSPVDRVAAAAFGLLSLPDGPDFDLAAATQMLATSDKTTRGLLERLVDAQLLEMHRPGRYQFHDLVRLYARHHVGGLYPEPTRVVTLTRLFEFYTASAWETMELLRPGDQRLATASRRWTREGRRFSDERAALSWLETERPNLLAAIAQAARPPAILGTLASQLTRALYGFFNVRGYWQDGMRANRTILSLAQDTDDYAAQAHAYTDLANFYHWLGRYRDAISCFQEGLSLHRRLGDRLGQAGCLNGLGIIFRRLGRHQEALHSQHDSLGLYERLGDRPGQAASLGGLGVIYERLGRYYEALRCQQESLELYRQLGDRHGQALSIGNLGVVYLKLERFEEALEHQAESLMIRRELGDSQCAALSLRNLGVIHLRLGQSQKALDCHQESLALRRQLNDRHGEAQSMGNLGTVYLKLGRLQEAFEHQTESLKLFQELGDRYGQAEALRDLGDILIANGHPHDARASWLEALSLCEAMNIPEADEIRDRLAPLSQ